MAQALFARKLLNEASANVAYGVSPGPRPLETIPGIYGIVGTVRFVSTYLGPLVRLRRSSDNAERDFYPLAGSDWVDTAAITTWLAGSTASIKTFYDQRGSKHWTQTSNATQPTLTISGTFAWATFSVSQNFQPTAGWARYTRYKDAVSYAVLAKLDGTHSGERIFTWFSQGTSGTTRRVALQIGAGRELRGNSTTHDDMSGGYYTPTAKVLDVGMWFRAVHRTNFRGGLNSLMADGNNVSSVMAEVVKTADTDSLSVRINNSGSNGLPISLVGFVAWDRQLTDAETSYVDEQISKYAPGYAPPVIPALIRLFGDSRFQQTQIADPNQRIQKFLSEGFATYRRVRNQAASGSVVSSARDVLKATTLAADDVVIVQSGINTDLQETTANHSLYISQFQEMYDYMPAGKRIAFCTVVPRSHHVTGTPQNANVTAFNNLLRAAFPNNIIELAQAMSTYDGNTTGAPPYTITPDSLHPNALGVSAVVGPTVRNFIVEKGW